MKYDQFHESEMEYKVIQLRISRVCSNLGVKYSGTCLFVYSCRFRNRSIRFLEAVTGRTRAKIDYILFMELDLDCQASWF